MAVERDHTLYSGIVIEGVYWMLAVVELQVFHERARLEFWPFLNERLRRQQLTEEETALPEDEQLLLKTAIRVPGLAPKIISVPGSFYQEYLAAAAHSGDGQNIVDACWRYAVEVAEPHGLRDFFASGQRV